MKTKLIPNTSKYLDEIAKLYRLCFPEDSADYLQYFISKKITDTPAYLTFDEKNNDKLVGMLFVAGKELAVFSEVVDVPFVFACGVHPDYRGQHIFSNMFLLFLRFMATRSYPFVLLHPFNHSFYRKFGFETIDFLYSNTIAKGSNQIKPLTSKADFLSLSNIYDKYTKGFDIAETRNAHDWNMKLDELQADDGYAALIVDEKNNTRGYMLFDRLMTSEVVHIDGQVSLNDLENEKYKSFFETRDIFPNTQCRLTNVDRALILFAKYLEKDFSLAVHDSQIPANNSLYCIQKGKVTKMNSANNEKADLTLDVGQLAKLLFGAHKYDVNIDEKLKQFFPPRRVAFFDKY